MLPGEGEVGDRVPRRGGRRLFPWGEKAGDCVPSRRASCRTPVVPCVMHFIFILLYFVEEREGIDCSASLLLLAPLSTVLFCRTFVPSILEYKSHKNA